MNELTASENSSHGRKLPYKPNIIVLNPISEIKEAVKENLHFLNIYKQKLSPNEHAPDF